MLTDSHCHLASHRFPIDEIPELLNRAKAAGVGRLITLATCLDDLSPNLELAKNPAVHACIGIHPCDVHQAPDEAFERLAEFKDDARVCAIGETGLDYYHPAPDGWTEEDLRTKQRSFLRRHFELAAAAGLNVVIHTRDQEGYASFEDAMTIYKDYHETVRAVFHCFIGPWENARRVIEHGGILSFGGVATFKTAHLVRETVKQCPKGSFMVETDAPYLAPEPYRGKRNEPSFVARTADFIATLRDETLDDLAEHTNEAAMAFFRLRKF